MSHKAQSPRADEILLGENLELLPAFADGSFQLIYIDPPFNTGKRAGSAGRCGRCADPDGDRTGFQGRRYAPSCSRESSYRDSFDDYLAFLAPRLEQAHRLLAREGTLYFHIDYREAHYCKLLLDEIFGRECFLNEIIWAYDYGARTRAALARQARHDPRLRQGPAGATTSTPRRSTASPTWRRGSSRAEKAARGKLPTDVWWHTIVPTNGAEKTGYPTQKPEGIAAAHGRRPRRGQATGALTSSPAPARSARSPRKLGRRYVLIDSNPEAVGVMRRRLRGDRAAQDDALHEGERSGAARQAGAQPD